MNVGDIAAAGILVLGALFTGFMIWRLWVEHPSRQPRRRRDVSCPDCGLDPHTVDCRFAWMGPPPTDFIFLTPEDLTPDHNPEQESETA